MNSKVVLRIYGSWVSMCLPYFDWFKEFIQLPISQVQSPIWPKLVPIKHDVCTPLWP